MKLCFFTNDYSAIGGVERVLSMISSSLSDDNDVHVVSMYSINGNQNDILYKNNVHIKTLIRENKNYIKHCFKVVCLLKEYLLANDIDIIIATSEMLSPYCYLALKRSRIKLVVWTHSSPSNKSEVKLQRLFRRFAIKKSSLTIALTENIMNELKKMFNVSNIISIPNPIDKDLLNNSIYNLESKKIITVGRICYPKYYEKLVEVASIVLKNNEDWIWDIYGDGEKDKLIELINDNNLNSKLNILGFSNNIYDMYNNYSIQVMTSRYEGFPMSILEGLAKGLPIVAFDIPGVNTIVRNNRNGMLIKPFDAESMANCIDNLIKNINLRKEISHNNFEDRNIYNLEKIKDIWNKKLLGVFNNEVVW